MRQPVLDFGCKDRIDRLLRIIVNISHVGVVPLPAPRIERRPIRNPKYPCGCSRCLTKSRRALPNRHKRIVDDLLYVFVARGESGNEVR